jgi:hypothetical protein
VQHAGGNPFEAPDCAQSLPYVDTGASGAGGAGSAAGARSGAAAASGASFASFSSSSAGLDAVFNLISLFRSIWKLIC